jgi:hypothetical protein
MDTHFLHYTWYSLDCLGHISLTRGSSYKVDLLVKRYDPIADNFVYSRIRNVKMEKHWKHTDAIPVSFAMEKGGDIDRVYRPLAFMLIPLTDETTTEPDYCSLEVWQDAQKRSRRVARGPDRCIWYPEGEHEYNDKGECACGESLSEATVIAAGR